MGEIGLFRSLVEPDVRLEQWRIKHAGQLLALLLDERDELLVRESWRPADFFTLAGQQRRAVAIEASSVAAESLHQVVLSGGDLVGTVGVDWALNDLDPGEVQLGYWIARRHRHRGFATAAARLALDDAARRGYRAARANVAIENAPSQAVLRRLGFATLATADPFEDHGALCMRFTRRLKWPLRLIAHLRRSLGATTFTTQLC